MTIKKLISNRFNGGLAHQTVVLKLQNKELPNHRRPANGKLLKNQVHDFTQRPQVENLFSNKLLKSFSSGDFARLGAHLESVFLSGNEELNKPGEKIDYVYFPEDTAVSQFQVLTDGTTAEIVMVGSEGMIGLDAVFGPQAPSFWTQTIMSGAAYRIKTEILKDEFLRSPHLRSLLLNYANTYIALISQRVSCNIRHVAETRFCTWLLMLNDRSRSEALRLTQEQIAACLGINRPTVTMLAKSLRECGIIDYSRGCIRILDRRRLEASACECYETVTNYLATESAVF